MKTKFNTLIINTLTFVYTWSFIGYLLVYMTVYQIDTMWLTGYQFNQPLVKKLTNWVTYYSTDNQYVIYSLNQLITMWKRVLNTCISTC